MPRKRTGKKEHPHFPAEIPREIETLLRDAQPTYADIEGELDARKRHERERERDVAVDRLRQMYREHEKRGRLDRLDPRVRLVCDLLKDRGCLLKPTGGRPTADYRAVLIAADVKESIDRYGGKWGSKELAYREVAERDRASYDHVKDLYLRAFSHNHDREFRRAVDLELIQRKNAEG